MIVSDLTYSELNKMFSDLIEEHRDDTEFFSAESAKKYANDEIVSGDYLCVQNAFDDLATKVRGLKGFFDWSFGFEGNDYDVGLIHNDAYDLDENYSVKSSMIYAECVRRNVAMKGVKEFIRIVGEMKCVKI